MTGKPRPPKAMPLPMARRVLREVETGLADLMFPRPGAGSPQGAPGRRAAAILASVGRDGASYFALRRRIDRAHYLAGDLPRTMAAMAAHSLVERYLDACPFARESPYDEADQVAAWLRRNRRVAPGYLVDLAAIEAAGFRLFDARDELVQAAASRPPSPRQSPALRLLQVSHDPDALLSEDPKGALPEAATLAVVAEAHDVEVYRVPAGEAAVLAACTGRRGKDQVLGSAALALGSLPAARRGYKEARRRGFLLGPP